MHAAEYKSFFAVCNQVQCPFSQLQGSECCDDKLDDIPDDERIETACKRSGKGKRAGVCQPEESGYVDGDCGKQCCREVQGEERIPYYTQACNIITEEAYLVPLYNGIITVAYNAGLQGVQAHCLGTYNFYHWSWK